MTTTGAGEIACECHAKKDMAGQPEWAFVGPVATLYGADRKALGNYYAGPTWPSRHSGRVR